MNEAWTQKQRLKNYDKPLEKKKEENNSKQTNGDITKMEKRSLMFYLTESELTKLSDNAAFYRLNLQSRL